MQVSCPPTFQFLYVSLYAVPMPQYWTIGSLCIKPPQGMECCPKSWLTAPCRYFWQSWVQWPGPFGRLIPYLELSRLVLQQWKHYCLSVYNLGLIVSVDSCRFPLIWVGALCEKLRPLALRREGAPKLHFLFGLSAATEAMHRVILPPLIKSPYWMLWSIFCNFDFRTSYQLRFSWWFRLTVGSSAENPDRQQEQVDSAST